jgi:hypothetical protein
VNNVHESVAFHHVSNHRLAGRALLVELGPLHSKFECFVLRIKISVVLHDRLKPYLPGHEADGFDNSRLYNLLAREDSPCNCVWTLAMGIGAKISSFIDSIIGDKWVSLDLRDQSGQ